MTSSGFEKGAGGPHVGVDARASDAGEAATATPSCAFDVTLKLRTADAAADAATRPRHELPSHHVPTLVAEATRAGGTVVRDAGRLLTEGEERRHRLGRAAVRKVARRVPRRIKAARQEELHNVVTLLTFENPWASFRRPTVSDAVHGGLKWGLPSDYTEGAGRGAYRGKGRRDKRAPVERRADLEKVEVRKPDWTPPADAGGTASSASPAAADADAEATATSTTAPRRQVSVSWLGHATTLVQFPALGGGGGGGGDRGEAARRPYSVLFDPLFSERCSPSQVAGPKRFTPAPCRVDELPPIDAVVISHNHYDHLDLDTVRRLRELRGEALRVFVPLGNKAWFTDEGFSKSQVAELDWWDEATVQPKAAESSGGGGGGGNDASVARLRITATPAQHGSGRGAGDKDACLWASWMLTWERLDDGGGGVPDARSAYRVFFAGDTGLRAYNESRRPRHHYPVCPAFKRVSARLGVPHLSLLPISVGSSLSYLRSWDPFPRRYSPFPRVESPLTSAIHADGLDAVHMLKIMSLRDEEGLEGPRSVGRRGHGHSRLDKGDEQTEEEEEQRSADVTVDEATVEASRKAAPQHMVALAVHYGTFVRNEAQVAEDLFTLRKACASHDVRFVRAQDGRLPAGADDEDGREGGGGGAEGGPRQTFVAAHQGEVLWLPMGG